MKYDDMPADITPATENDWLDVTFVQKQKIDQQTADLMQEGKTNFLSKGVGKVKGLFAARKKDRRSESEQSDNGAVIYRSVKRRRVRKSGRLKNIWQKSWKPAAACLVIALALVGMRYADGGFVGDVFGYAKATFTSALVQTDGADSNNVMTLPSNADVAVSNGDITLTGGSLAVNLKDGKVKETTETSVTVNVGENFDIVYSNLSEVMVASGDTVTQYQVLGKYGDSAVVNLIIDGQKVTGVTADGYTVSWQI